MFSWANFIDNIFSLFRTCRPYCFFSTPTVNNGLHFQNYLFCGKTYWKYTGHSRSYSEPVGLETKLPFFKWSLWVAGTREKNVSLTSRPYNVKQNIVIIHGLRNHSLSRIILVQHSFYVRVRDCRYCHLRVNQNHIWIYQVK